MSKKLISLLTVAGILFSSVGVFFDRNVIALNAPVANGAANDPYIALGDCNLDGIVNSKDIIALKMYLSGQGSVDPITADANKDGKIDINDIYTISETVFSKSPETVENFPPVKDVPDGTLIYREDFESTPLSSHSFDTLGLLKWDMQNTDKGAFSDNTAEYSIVEYNSGKALYINNNKDGATDSYVELLTSSQMGYFHEKNFTLQYDLQYTDAASISRYITLLLGYSGNKYISFHLRNGGYGNNQLRNNSDWYTIDGGAYSASNTQSNSISAKLLGKEYDGSTQVFKNVALCIRYVVDWENGCKIFIKTKDNTTASGGQWILVSQFSAESAGANLFKANGFDGAVALKVGGQQNGFIDNIMLWTGTGDTPLDNSPLLTSGIDECYNHAYNDATCLSCRSCRYCDYERGQPLPHELVSGICKNCKLTVEQIGKLTGFTNVSPANGSTVKLANNDIYNWYNGYTQNSTYSQSYYQHKDIYYPVPLTLNWTVEKPADYYRVTVSDNKDLRNGDSYVLTSPSVTLGELFVGTNYYWQVDAVYENKVLRSEIYTFSTAMSPRTVKIEGVSNTRDFGGYNTSFGYRVKQGMIYRGGHLDEITENGRNYILNTLGIKTDVDVRNGSSSALGSAVKFLTFNGRSYTGDNGIVKPEDAAIFAQEVRAFADPSNYPLYLHCSLGRDRTGTLACVINALLGVDEKTLRMDYELSVFSVTGTLDNASISILQQSINNVIAYLNTFPGNTLAQRTENYLLGIGITPAEIQSIRNILWDNPEAVYNSTSIADMPIYNAAASEMIGMDEIPYGNKVDGVQLYGYDTFNMMTESEAASSGVPSGYSDHVLAITGGNGGVGIMVDPTDKQLYTWEVEKITFRVWCPANTKEVRITSDAGKTWIMRYSPSVKEQWIDIELGDGINFHPGDGHNMSSLGYDNGLLKPINFAFRFNDQTTVSTAYIDSIKYTLRSSSPKSEIPYGAIDTSVQLYTYDKFEMMTYSQAVANNVPSGYTGFVLGLSDDIGHSVGIVVDPTDRNIHVSNLESIKFRVWCPANTKEVRITADAGKNWIMRYTPSATGQWIDIVLKNGTNFYASHTLSSLCDSNGILKRFSLGFRFTDSNTYTTAYIDSITFNLSNTDTVPPVINFSGSSTLQMTEGSKPNISATAFDAHENRNIGIKYNWSDGAMDDNGCLIKGVHFCTLTATDTSGNTTEKVLTVVVGNKDTIAPTILHTPTEITAYIGSMPILSFKAIDNIDKVTTTLSWSANALDKNGRLNAGNHTLTLTSVDSTGNKTQKVIPIIVTERF